jgi:hypothetical protein
LGTRTGGWVCFYKTVGDRKIAFVPQRGKPGIGFVFSNLPRGPGLGTRTGGWVCFYKIVADRKIGFAFTKPSATAIPLASLPSRRRRE